MQNGAPLNIRGRTGLRGRGILGRYGPNHAADPIVTRWKRDECGAVVNDEKSGKPILQFVSIQRRDTGEWAIPGGINIYYVSCWFAGPHKVRDRRSEAMF